MPAGKVIVNASDPDSWAPPLGYKAVAYDSLHHELIGEDEDGSEAPEDAGEGPQPENVVQMGPDSDGAAPGPSAAPTFSAVVGPSARNVPRPRTPRLPMPASSAIEQLRERIARREPGALKTLFRARALARTSPQHAALLRALLMKPVAAPVFSGEIPNQVVTNTIVKILNLALTPVVWAAHGTGIVVSEAGNLLESLSKKL